MRTMIAVLKALAMIPVNAYRAEREWTRVDRVVRRIFAGLGPAVLLLCATTSYADEPYVELWGSRGNAWTLQPDPTDKGISAGQSWDAKGYWGGELLFRIPRGRFSAFGQGVVEGASNAFVLNQPGTWRRLIGKGGLGFRVLTFLTERPDGVEGRYTCSVFAGVGFSVNLESAAEGNRNAPAIYGGGIHCRDDRLGGSGPLFATAVHIPAFSKRTAIGVDATFGEATKVQLLMKVNVWRKEAGE